MNELGVGVVYFRGFEGFLASHSSLIDVVEIEPQTFWYDRNDRCDAFKHDAEVINFLQAYERPILFHGVGYPIGGACLPSEAHFNTLKQQAEALDPGWISEHLSFNMFKEGKKAVNSGFLLPPLQSAEGIEVAAANIRNYKAQMNLSFAFETGTNYLRPRKDEIPDGLFTRMVAEAADCHILLDLHNILANQRNGRQGVLAFFDSLPHERIIELHVGGGMYYKDYYLDAHSGPSDKELLDLMRYVVTRLPNLKALIFEIDPDSFTKVPEAALVNQLTAMHRIWNKRGIYCKGQVKAPVSNTPVVENLPSVNDWEFTLGRLALGKEPQTPLAAELAKDPGLGIVKDLIFNFRGSVLVSMLRLTTRLLRLSVGEELFNAYVNDFFDKAFPELLPVIVAEEFAVYILSKNIKVPYLGKILEYELFSIYTAIDKINRTVSFNFDPAPVFVALENARLPGEQPMNKTVKLEIVYEQPSLKSELLNYSQVVHI